MPGFQVLDNVGGIATFSSMVLNHNCDYMVICGHYSFTLSHPLGQCFSTGGSLAPQGAFDNVCRHFWLSQLGRGAMASSG